MHGDRGLPGPLLQGCADLLFLSGQRAYNLHLLHNYGDILFSVQGVCRDSRSLVRGRPVLEAYTIDSSAIATALGGLEPEYMHCAMMAELALKRAVLDYAGKRKEGQPVKAAPPM